MERIFNKYYENSAEIKDYKNLIVELIYLYDLKNYINSIIFTNDNSFYYAFYDINSKKLCFSNSIFKNNYYNENATKAFTTIIHEIIHVLQFKILDENYDIPELINLKSSLKKNILSYKKILPLHEYQAYLNSNVLLFDFLYRKNHLDFINCIDLTTNILYNNYYDENLIFTSPIEQKINRIENNKNIKHDAFLHNDLNKIQFGLPVNEKVLKKIIYNLNILKGS